MEQRLTMITLGVRDLASARAFYEKGLGWSASTASSDGIAFYQVGGMVFALFGRAALAGDAGIEDTAPGGFSGVALAYNGRDRAEVNAVLARAVDAGATLVKPAAEAFWGGYSGYFADPEGHLWEVAHNPFWRLDAQGNVRLPEPE